MLPFVVLVAVCFATFGSSSAITPAFQSITLYNDAECTIPFSANTSHPGLAVNSAYWTSIDSMNAETNLNTWSASSACQNAPYGSAVTTVGSAAFQCLSMGVSNIYGGGVGGMLGTVVNITEYSLPDCPSRYYGNSTTWAFGPYTGYRVTNKQCIAGVVRTSVDQTLTPVYATVTCASPASVSSSSSSTGPAIVDCSTSSAATTPSSTGKNGASVSAVSVSAILAVALLSLVLL